MIWEISPLIGLGPLKFGMKPEDIALIDGLGPVTNSFKAYDGSVNEYRTMDIPVCNYAKGILAAVDTNSQVKNLTLDGMDIYNTPPLQVIQTLERLNGGAKSGLGSMLFINIGINISGFYIEEEKRLYEPEAEERDERGLGMFIKGAFDSVIDEYEEITFL